jgi:hypothetical protein
MYRQAIAPLILILLLAAPLVAAEPDTTYSETEIGEATEGFFEGSTKGLAELIQKAFEDYGEPNGYIKGNEASGAFFAGLRYGEGFLVMKGKEPLKVYWQGPTLGLDIGGNAVKVFTLVYNLPEKETIFQRFPGVDGSAYFVGGLSMNYQKSGQVVLAPIRTGVGLRLGANIGYLHYTRESHANPF